MNYERKEKLAELIRSKLFMALAILITVDCAFTVLNNAVQNGIFSIAFCAIPVLMAIGVWTFHNSTKTGNYKAYSFAFMKIHPIALGVIFIIGAVACLILLLTANLILTESSKLIEQIENGSLLTDKQRSIAMYKEIFGIEFAEGGIYSAADHSILCTYDQLRAFIKDVAPALLYGGSAVGILVLSYMAFFSFRVSKAVNSLRNAVMFGYDEPVKTGLLSVTLYILGGLSFAATVTMIISGAAGVLGIVQNLVNCAVMIIAAIIYGRIKDITE
ncbi:MAG: hypothetical protein J5793_05170 [Clostridia bacterium]|nr:hypothetical protein [Clostridia bacterium]